LIIARAKSMASLTAASFKTSKAMGSINTRLFRLREACSPRQVQRDQVASGMAN
jgi:hypothetical protein